MNGCQVVVGVDGSVPSFRALDVAAAEADRRGTALEIVYCVPDRDMAGPVLTAAAERIRERCPRLPVLTSAVVGDPAKALTERGREAALTVVGSRGLGPFAGWLFGSVSRRVAARTLGPLLVVRGEPPVRGEDGGDDHEVLLGLENDSDTESAVYAFADADRRGVPLHVLRTRAGRRPPPLDASAAYPAPDRTAGARRVGAEAHSPAPVLAPPRRTDARRTAPAGDAGPASAHVLLDATRHADVVVMAAHRGGHRRGLRFSPAATVLLRHAHCPVLVVPVCG